MAVDYGELPAVKVMGKTGFHQMSRHDLASEANVSVGLIYRYFGGKEDLLVATIGRILDVFRDPHRCAR